MPGVGVRVAIGGRRWDATLGVADVTTGKPYALDDYVRIASVTKTFTATAILQLVDEHRLALDDTVDQFVPGIPNGKRITIHDLLAMSSGVFDYTSDPNFSTAFTADPARPWIPQQAVKIMREHAPDFAPGTRTVYSDSNYILLGLVLEKVTGQTAGTVINRRVVEVAKLPHTTFPLTPTLPRPHPTGYLPADPGTPGPPVAVGNVNPNAAWTAGAMNSTVDDLERWSKVLADGSLLSPKLQAERLRFKRFDGVKINAGYGLGVERINDIVGHNGAIVGFSTAMYRIPKYDATFVVVGNGSTNSTTPTSEIALLMIQALYPEQVR
jgi:D-alanyl-D-alanine carboxypeptidase